MACGLIQEQMRGAYDRVVWKETEQQGSELVSKLMEHRSEMRAVAAPSSKRILALTIVDVSIRFHHTLFGPRTQQKRL